MNTSGSCEGNFRNRHCKVNTETGDVTIGSVRVQDEGTYMCRRFYLDRDAIDSVKQLNVNGE